jgi:hypothetical protein
LISHLNNVKDKPEHVERYIDLVKKERVWTLLNKRDGSTFRTFDEFCEHEQPWGLGRPFSKIKPYLEAMHGKKSVDLLTVAPSRQGERTDLATSPHDEARLGHATNERLRAICRADPYVQELYRQGLVSQTVAARMGPARKTDEKASELNNAVNTVRTFIKPEKMVRDGADPRKVRRAVDKKLKEILGVATKPTVESIVRYVLRSASGMDEKQRRELFAAIQKTMRM